MRAEDEYELVKLQSIYSEDYVYGGEALLATGSWNTGPLHYLFRRDDPGASAEPCNTSSTVKTDGNIPGGDLREAEAISWSACAVACEAEPRCQGWTFDCCNNSRPGSAGCYLKSTISSIGTFHGDYAGCSLRGIAASASACCASHARTNVRYSVPPHGMRSAVALGPVGGGSLELRADGRLADWRLLNNQPPIGGKVSAEAAAFALHLSETDGNRHTALLRTHAPEASLQLPTVDSMEYAGAFPASRIKIVDSNFTRFVKDPVQLYGVSGFKMQDVNASSIPSISFVVAVPPSSATSVALMLSLPSELLGNGTAVIFKDGRVVFTQARSGDRQGQIVLSARSAGGEHCAVSWEAAANLSALMASFSSVGELANSTSGGAVHGAIAVKVARNGDTVESTSSTVLSITLSWYLPMRHWQNNELIGQAYSQRFASGEEVAALAETPEHLSNILRDAAVLQSLHFNNTLLPLWLQDGLVNSVSALYKTGMWLEDGRYRQFESFSCPQIENPHIQKPRILAALHLLPTLERSELMLHLDKQTTDKATGVGMVAENFGGSPLDTVCAGPRGDDNAVVIFDVLANVMWTANGEAWLKQVWPKVKSVIQWQLRQAQMLGTMPALTNTYDEAPSMGLDGTNSWNAFLHLAAVKAAEQLASRAGDLPFAANCTAALVRARSATIDLLWDETHSRFRGYVCHASGQNIPTNAENTDNLMADSLYGVLWSELLDLDLGLNKTLYELHQRSSFATANQFGLPFWTNKTRDYACQPLPGNQKGDQFTDDTIWSAHAVDEGALALFLRAIPTSTALKMAERTYTMYSTHLRDSFDFRDVGAVRSDGPNGTTGVRPYCNSHYTRHLLGLHALPLALSGQRYNAATSSLSFSPKRDHRNRRGSERWSFFTPQGSGLIEEWRDGERSCVRLQMVAGSLSLRELRIDGCDYTFNAHQAGTDVVQLNTGGDATTACAVQL